MSERFMTDILKITALAGVFSLLYPGVLVARFLLFPDSAGIGYLLLSIVIQTGGFLAASVIVREKSAFFSRLAEKPVVEFIFEESANVLYLSSATAWMTVLVPLAAAALAFWKEGWLRVLFEVIIAGTFYIMGLRGRFREYDNIMSDGIVRAGIFISAAALIANYKMGISLYIYNLPYISILALMVVTNQVNIERVFLKMNRQLSGISKGIRNYNLIFVLVLFCMTAFLLNFKRVVVFLLNVVKSGFQAVLLMFFKFISQFFSDEKPEALENPVQGTTPLFIDESGSNPYSRFIFRVIVYFVVMYSIYRLAPAIWRLARKTVSIKTLSAIWKSVGRFITKILSFLRSVFKGAVNNEEFSDEYMDKIEFINEMAAGKKSGVVRKHAKRSMRGFRKLTDPIEKIRFLYGMVIDGVILRRVYIEKSDTTGEICRKSVHVVNSGEAMNSVTKTYEKARYGDSIPTKEELDMLEDYCMKLDGNLFK